MRDPAVSLGFRIASADAPRHAVMPCVVLDLEIDARAADVAGVALQAQVRVDAALRAFSAVERARLSDVWGGPERFSANVGSLLWSNVAVNVGPFEGTTRAPLTLFCGHDLGEACGKLFAALEGGTLPLTALFSGSVYHRDASGALAVAPVPRSAEARFDLPVAVVRTAIDHHLGGGAVVRLRRDVAHRLARYREARGLDGLDAAVERLLDASGGAA